MRLRTLAWAAGAALICAGAPAVAQFHGQVRHTSTINVSAAEEAAIMAPFKAFIAAANKDDLAAMTADFTDAPSIVDTVPPYHWSGAGALSDWFAALAADAKTQGDTVGVMSVSSTPTEAVERGDQARLVVSSVYRYKHHGRPVVEPGAFTVALDKTAGGWKVAAWTYAKR